MFDKIGNYKVGPILFLLTILIALFNATVAIFGIEFWKSTSVGILLFILGLLVGIYNITIEEETKFMVASLVLMLGSSVMHIITDNFPIKEVSLFLNAFLYNMLLFTMPAAILIAIKVIVEIMRD